MEPCRCGLAVGLDRTGGMKKAWWKRGSHKLIRIGASTRLRRDRSVALATRFLPDQQATRFLPDQAIAPVG